MLSENQIKETISGFLKLPIDKLKDDAVLTELVHESFVLVEMVMFLQDEFQVRIIQQDLRNVRTMGELVKVFQAKSA
jgi:acyl carrier protein